MRQPQAGAIQPVQVRPKLKGSVLLGSECCVATGDSGCEAYTFAAFAHVGSWHIATNRCALNFRSLLGVLRTSDTQFRPLFLLAFFRDLSKCPSGFDNFVRSLTMAASARASCSTLRV